MSRFALARAGAVGDVIMVLNLIPALKKKYPDAIFDFFCHQSIGDQLSPLFELAGVSQWFPTEAIHALKQHYTEVFYLEGYPMKEGYPHTPMRQHLINFFAEDAGLPPQNPLYQLKLSKLESMVSHPYVTVHPKAGWSRWKNWAFENWEEVIGARPRLQFIQIGSSTDYKLRGADHSFMSQPLMTAVNLIANAKLHLGVDSFSNHVTHMTGTPAIILWGSTQVQAAGYPENTNISLGLSCQPCFKEDPGISALPLGPCTHDHACMRGISVDQVLEALEPCYGC